MVYQPLKYNKDSLNDFSDFLAEIRPKYDRVLIIGDFNVHVCCPDKPMAKGFLFSEFISLQREKVMFFACVF